jgi:hypothetical protein
LRTGNHVRVVGGLRQNRERVVGGPYDSVSNLEYEAVGQCRRSHPVSLTG